MADELELRHQARRVGRLHLDDQGRFCFRYRDSWLASRSAFPISRSLPMASSEVVGAAAHAFFVNLLPEGLVRQRVAARLGISEGNDFELLRALGGECAGALSIVPPDSPLDVAEPKYEQLSPARLDELSRPGAVIPLLVGGATTRLSLAGAQDKLPVFVDGHDLYLSIGGSPTTHILKIGNPNFAHLLANEAFTTWFAKELGLDVVETSLVTSTTEPLLLVRRYDRVLDEDASTVRRLHQEDFCQALGLRPTQKYQLEGGPRLSDCVELARDHVANPLVDTQRLLQWAIFNLLSGNADGHGKNIALRYDERALPSVAPFYDLVCTRAYRTIERHLAMALGAESDPGQVSRQHWLALADELEIRNKLLLALVSELLDASEQALARTEAAFRSRYGAHPALEMVPPTIRRQVRRTRTLLAEPP